MPKTKISVSDIIVIAVISLSALLMFLAFASRENGRAIRIDYDGGKTKVCSLDKDEVVKIESNGISLTVVISDGCAYVGESTCRDQICVSTGKIRKKGETIVCAPAAAVIRVLGGESDVDQVAG